MFRASKLREAAYQKLSKNPSANFQKLMNLIEQVSTQEEVHMEVEFHSYLSTAELSYLIYLGYQIESECIGSYTISWYGFDDDH
jgi:hypothetical protein